ncbi:MAG: hypothetical protein HC879_11270 [Leptolyngbyaceae cyanobacterium SL_5_9]|nr:hypothetical protein [Leptolyngbyaceae cyanobacterium SL_5_9]
MELYFYASPLEPTWLGSQIYQRGYCNHPLSQEQKPLNRTKLNIAENELSSLARQCLADERSGDIKTLQEATSVWAPDVNHTECGVDWSMKIDDARCKLISVYPKIKR